MPANSKSSDPSVPLSGLVVVELASIGPVPFAGRMLRQLGADVVIVDPPTRREVGVPVAGDSLEAGKRRVAIDLKSATGRDQLMALLATADALIEGFRPGTLERLGLLPALIHAQLPGLVIGRCGGWGSGNPRAAHAGHDINYLALAGVLGAVGPAAHPVVPLNLIGDFGGAGMHLAFGVVAALLAVQRGAPGAVVETSILEATVSLTAHLHGLIDAGLWNDRRDDNLLDGGAPFYAVYRTADDRWLAIGALEPKFYAELVERLGAALDTSRQHDRSYWPTMRAELARCIASRTRDDWDQALAATDACATAVLDWCEARAHPHLATAFDADGPACAVRFT